MGAGSSKKVTTPDNFNLDSLSVLSPEVRIQLEKYAENQENCIQELKERYEQLRVDSEQQHFEDERQLSSTSEKLEIETKTAAELRKQVSELERKYNEAACKARELQATEFEKEARFNEVEQINCKLSNEKQELSNVVDKKSYEIEQLTAQWKEMSQRLAESNKARIEALAKVDEIQSQIITVQYREQRFKQERDSLEQQNDWLQTEVRDKTQAIMSVRKEQSSQILNLQSQLEEKSDEMMHLQQLVNSLKEANDDQSMKIENYLKKLKEARDNQAQVDEQYNVEIQSQKKLVEIYKNAAEKKGKEVERLMPTIKELEHMLKDANADHAEFESERNSLKEQYEDVVKDCEGQITQLKKELQDANELIDAMRRKGVLAPTEENVEALSPAAAAASHLLKSGMTLTQIYTEYVQTTEALHLEKEENNRLNDYLNQILQEIEEKAPILKKQKDDYEQSLESMSHLTQQLDTAMLENQKLHLKYDEAYRISKEMTRENSRLQQSCKDAGQQVRMLLKELEEARGNIVSTSYNDDLSSADVSSSNQVITDNLVTFRSIEELQEQNERLLAAIRDLSEQRDEEEAESADNRVVELKAQLGKAVSEIEEMQASRHRQAEMVESIVRQRDMYKMMLNQSSNIPAIGSPKFSTPIPQQQQYSPHVTPVSGQRDVETSQPPTDKAAEALKELQKDFDVYRKEKSENEKILSEQLDKYRQETSNMRVLHAKLSSQLEFSNERYKVLQANVEGYKKEISALREKSQKLSVNNAKYEETNATYRVELLTCQENFARAEAMCQNLRVEKDMLKSIEQRLLQEKEMYYKEQKSRDMLLENLQSIQNNLERSDFENKAKLGQKIDSYEKENTMLRRKLDGVNDEHNKRSAMLEKQLSETRTALDKERAVLESNREQLRTAAQELTELKQQLGAAQSKLTTAPVTESIQRSVPDNKMAEEIKLQAETLKDLRTQLSAAHIEHAGVRTQLDDALKKAEQYKSIAESVEKHLEEQNQVSKELEKRVNRQLEESKQDLEHLESVVKELQSANEYLQKEKDILASENAKLLDDTNTSSYGQQKRFDTLQQEFVKLKDERDRAVQVQEELRREIEEQQSIVRDAQDTYQRELVLHAANVSKLTEVKQELSGYQAKLDKAIEEASSAQKILQTREVSWSEQEAILKRDHSVLEERLREIQNQNMLLHQELEQLSEKMMQLQNQTERNEEEQKTLAHSVIEEGENRSSDQLLEVVRYLRKERDISETKLEGLQAENIRLKHQLEYHTKQLDEANRSLDETKYNEQISMQTAVQHSELMKKVETLNLLQDSNRMLREERDRAVVQIQHLEAKIKELDGQILPLQETKKYLQGQYEALQVERNSLQAEVHRWKARTDHLIEQCNKADPEEYKRMMQERDLVKKQLTTANEETHKLRTDLMKTRTNVMSLETELNTCKQSLEKANTELALSTEANEQKDKEIKDNTEKLTQLRKIGRKYRMQAEEVQKKLDEHLAGASQLQMEEEHKAKIAEMESKVKKVESELTLITENLAVAESEKNIALKAIKDHETNVTKLSDQLHSTTEQLNKEKEDSLKEKDALIKAREEVIEHRKKYNKSCQVLSGAKDKLSSQKNEIERLTTENQTLQSRLSALEQRTVEYEAQAAAMRSQYEGRLTLAQREFDERQSQDSTSADTERDKIMKENAALRQELKQLRVQLESQLKQSPPTAPSRSTTTPAERPGTSAETVKTANIKPMTTPTTTSRHIQSAMIQPVRSAADQRVRASVQPMAASTTTTSVTQSTPTATVMPVSVQESDNTQQVAPLSQMSPQHVPQQLRPTQQVQPVSHVEDVQDEEPEEVQDPEPVPAATQSMSLPILTQAPVQPITTQSVTATVVSTQAIMTQPPTLIVVSTQSQTSVTPAAGQPVPAVVQPVPAAVQSIPAAVQSVPVQVIDTASTQGTGSQTPTSKRPRDDGESSDDQVVLIKRTKTQSPAVADVAPSTSNLDDSPESVPEKKEGQVEALVEPAVPAEGEQTPSEDPVEEAEDFVLNLEVDGDGFEIQEPEDYEDTEDEEYPEEEEDTGDSVMVEEQTAIIVTSEEEEVEEGQMDEYDDDDEEDNVQEDDDDDGAEGMQDIYDEDEEEMDDDMDEPMQDDDDDVIVVADEEDAEQSPDEVSMNPPHELQPAHSQSDVQPDSQSAPVSHNVPQLARVPSQSDRLFPVTRAQQLPPFLFGSHEGAGFEVGDDGIVPSTPTLVVPRRHDDFAQAVSSPQIQRRFVFGGSTENVTQQTDSARLESQGGILSSNLQSFIQASGVDDIRMDLTQFDEAGGSRSVPVTPISQTPPAIMISEASPPHTETQAEQPPSGIQPETQPECTAMSTQGESSRDSSSQGEPQPEGGSEDSKDHGDITNVYTRETEGETSLDDKPCTSDNTHDKSEPAKPKIQRIVWDKPDFSSSSSPQISSTPQLGIGIPTTIPGQRRGQRGRGQRMQRPMQRTSGIEATPLMGPSVARGQPRGRGTRTPKRGVFHPQHHRQPPF